MIDSEITIDSRYHDVVSSLPDGVVVANTSGLILFVNPAAEIVLGKTSQQLLGKPFSYSEASDGTTEIEILQSNSEPLVLEMRVAQTTWEGKPAMLATLRDISERLQLTRDLKHSNDELAKFASVLSHDIKAPLHNLSQLASWLEKDHSATLNYDALEDVRRIKTSATRMKQMVQNLLHYSRVDARQKKTADVELIAVLDDAKMNLSEDIFKTGATISNDPLPTIDCNVEQMTTLFEHVLKNSLQHSVAKPLVHIESSNEDDHVILRFNDNGKGVDKKFWETVFTPFTDLHGDAIRRSAGIGLATCRKIADMHNGNIWLESEPGVGTTVFLKLPIKSATGSAKR